MYTCPMHPEVRTAAAGSCPTCGMGLEPVETGGEAGNPELTSMRQRFWVGAALTAPLLVVAMGQELPGVREVGSVARGWLQLALAAGVVGWAGWPILQRGAASIRHRSLNMFTLIGLGATAAFAYSVAALVAPDLFPAALRGPAGEVDLYFEAAAVIVTLALLGQVLELGARARTGDAIRGLLRLSPPTARRIGTDGSEVDVELSAVRAGDRLRVLPGAIVPVDGAVVEGRGAIDESMITGEPLPADRGPGDRVIGGTVCGMGGFVMRAERVGDSTLLARMVRMVQAAQRSRAPVQRLADRVSGVFVPLVLVVAALTLAGWWYAGEPRMGLVTALAVLIVACPCALGLATPMSIMVGTGRGATAGVLIRDAEALETMARVDTLVVDKTGTLTEGRPALLVVESKPGVGADDMLRAAASLERASEHPLAGAVIGEATERGIELLGVEDVHPLPGKGIVGGVGRRRIAVGNRALMGELSVDLTPVEDRAGHLERQGYTVVFVAIDGLFAGLLGVADPIKATTAEAVRSLRRDGLRLLMLTGDNEVTAGIVARRLGIDEYQAEALPEEKLAAVERLQAAGRRVAVAGDGVNDAPALARADVGVAMGTGTDIAMENSGITLVGGDLRGIAAARRLSRLTLRNIRQNLAFAFLYNLLAVPVAAGALYPWFGVLLSPMVASAAMSFSSVSVIGNALRLRRARL